MDVERLLDEMGVEHYRTGDRFMVCCVFHNDTNPSCGIWVDSGYFKCFGCGEEGSMVDFLMEADGITCREAVRKVRGQDSISDLEDSIHDYLDRTEKELRYFKWSSFRSTYSPVVPDTKAWDYLLGRGLNGESIIRFNVRWGGDRGKFRYRVILPIRTMQGKLLSYVGRATRVGMVPKTRKARSPHRTLFGLYELIEKVERVSVLVIVEGEFDAIYLQQYGVPAIANMGTSPMGAEKIRLLRRYAHKIVLSYDGDEAGQKAMHGDDKKRGELRVLSQYMPTFSVHLPDGCDPNSLTPKQVEEIYGNYRMC